VGRRCIFRCCCLRPGSAHSRVPQVRGGTNECALFHDAAPSNARPATAQRKSLLPFRVGTYTYTIFLKTRTSLQISCIWCRPRGIFYTSPIWCAVSAWRPLGKVQTTHCSFEFAASWLTSVFLREAQQSRFCRHFIREGPTSQHGYTQENTVVEVIGVQSANLPTWVEVTLTHLPPVARFLLPWKETGEGYVVEDGQRNKTTIYNTHASDEEKKNLRYASAVVYGRNSNFWRPKAVADVVCGSLLLL